MPPRCLRDAVVSEMPSFLNCGSEMPSFLNCPCPTTSFLSSDFSPPTSNLSLSSYSETTASTTRFRTTPGSRSTRGWSGKCGEGVKTVGEPLADLIRPQPTPTDPHRQARAVPPEQAPADPHAGRCCGCCMKWFTSARCCVGGYLICPPTPNQPPTYSDLP